MLAAGRQGSFSTATIRDISRHRQVLRGGWRAPCRVTRARRGGFGPGTPSLPSPRGMIKGDGQDDKRGRARLLVPFTLSPVLTVLSRRLPRPASRSQGRLQTHLLRG